MSKKSDAFPRRLACNGAILSLGEFTPVSPHVTLVGSPYLGKESDAYKSLPPS